MIKKQIFEKIITWSIAIFISSVLVLMFYKYFLDVKPPIIVIGITITSIGVFLITLLLDRFLSLKDSDSDYFKNIMIGISGGLAVWVLSETDFSFKEGFWLTMNGFAIRVGFAIMVILIGYKICKKKK